MAINSGPQTYKSDVIKLEKILNRSELLVSVFKGASQLDLPNWYIGAGCIAQTIWNDKSGLKLDSNIKDIDLVYFDSTNLSYEKENNYIKKAEPLFKDIPIPFDIKNQARVHIWYEKHFGYSIKPYQSSEEAIQTWPTTATSIGIKYIDGHFSVYAPFGLEDLLSLTVRANKVQITEDVYLKKITRWKQCWPDLHIIPW